MFINAWLNGDNINKLETFKDFTNYISILIDDINIRVMEEDVYARLLPLLNKLYAEIDPVPVDDI